MSQFKINSITSKSGDHGPVIGGCALGHAVFMGANKLETVKILVDEGASLDFRTFGGGSVLTSLITREDSDPDILRFVLEKLRLSEDFSSIINYKTSSTTLKWKSIYCLAKIMYRAGLVKTGLMTFLAFESGTTALNLAVMRGDVEIVKILLENSADPHVKNDLGMNAFEMCNKIGPFLSVQRALREHINKEK